MPNARAVVRILVVPMADAADSSAPTPAGDIPPSQTLYIQNLTEKVKKAPLKTALYAAFSPFGRIVDIVHCRSNALRGQAWVVLSDVASATAAMAKMQAFPLFDKPMVRPRARARPLSLRSPLTFFSLSLSATNPPAASLLWGAAHLLRQGALARD